MADAEQVPSDLTLELGGNRSPERFLVRPARSGCVEEISQAVARNGEAPNWIVRTQSSYRRRSRARRKGPACTAGAGATDEGETMSRSYLTGLGLIALAKRPLVKKAT